MNNKDIKVVIIDNYDSFTYNLVHIVNELLDAEVTVLRNDEFDIKDIDAFDYIILSPGPGIPDEAGLLKTVIKTYAPTKQIFGVCLGLQAIGEVFGAKLINLSKVYHGVKTKMHLTDKTSKIFNKVPSTFEAGRYHSWAIDGASDTSAFHITCVDDEGQIMGIQHKEHAVYAVQFHPESIMTSEGKLMIANFLNIEG